MHDIKRKLTTINSQIKQAELIHNRTLGSVKLLAVSKTKPASYIAEAYSGGQKHFGESYLQEALAKQLLLSEFAITWHFIGPIQANKTKQIAANFSWVHSVARLKIAKRLNEQRPPHLPALNICLQVNISSEASKSGIRLDELPSLIKQLGSLSNLRLRGVMAIPEPTIDFEAQRIPYRRLYQAVKQLNILELDTFSFGMSADLEAAIAEGATIIRIGSALFGARDDSYLARKSN